MIKASFRPLAASVTEWLGGVLERERERWVLWLPVCLGSGVAVYFALASEPPLWLGTAALAASVALGLACRQRPVALVAFLALAVFSLGFAAAQWRTAMVAAPVLTERLGPTSVIGRIVLVETFPNGGRITLERPRINGLAPELTPEKVRFRIRGAQPRIYPGDWVSLRGVLSPPSPPAMPGAFDFQRRSYFMGLGGVGFAYGSVELTARTPVSGAWGAWLALEKFRQNMAGKVIKALKGPPGSANVGDANVGAVAAALMTGKRSAIPKDLMESVRNSGLAHLLAISGLHIGLVAGFLFVAVRGVLALAPPLALRYPIKKWAALIAIFGALAYALAAGATVPTQRAFLMICIVLLAVLLDRRGLSMRSVAWAAAVILLFQPESLLGASFQMSFAAVTALIAAYEALQVRRLSKGRAPPVLWLSPFKYLFGVALTTLIAGAATAPFALYHFNNFQAYGLAANLIAVPVTALWTMPWAVIAFALTPFGLEHLALTPMGWGVEVIINVAKGVSSWPGAVNVLPSMPTWGVALTALGGLWLCLWRRPWRLWGAAGLAVGLSSILLARPPDILIDAKGKLMAVQTADGGLAMSSMRAARFNRNIWLRRAGQGDDASSWPKSGQLPNKLLGPGKRLTCDFMGCVYRAKGHVVALVRDVAALPEDCLAVDIVVSAVPVRSPCPSAQTVIDRFDLWRLGGHALWLRKDGVRVESVNGVRGDRPWVVKPKMRPPKGKGGL